MKLFLVRHSETVENVNQVHQGHFDGTLTKNGFHQAERLARRLREEKFDAIYSSDLGRAAETAKAIAKYHSKTPVYLVKELRERDMAEFCGEPWVDEWDWDNLPKTVEQNDSMMKRASYILERVYGKYPKGTVLFVSHGGLLNALLAVIEGREMSEQDFILLDNTSITVLEVEGNGNHRVHLINCVKHLE